MSDDQINTGANTGPNQDQVEDAEHHKNRPIKVFRDGSLKASIWRNEGKHSPMYKTKFAKLYEDQDGNLKETQSLDDIDLLKSSELGKRAYVYIAGRKRRDRELAKSQGQKQRQGKSLAHDR